MNIIKLKIHEYNEEFKTLVVSFASDTTLSQNPDDYPKRAFQLSFFDLIDSIDDIKIKLANTGIDIIRQQVKEEQVKNDNSKDTQLKSLVGNTFDLPIFLVEQNNTDKNEVLL